MEIKVDEDNVQVRTSLNKPMIEIENLIRRKKNWIVNKQNEYRKRGYHITKPTFKVDSTLPYLGKNIPVKISNNLSATDTIELIDGEFKLSIHGKESPRN